MYKKLLSLIAILTMLLLIFAGNVHAASDTEIGKEMLLYGIFGDVNGDRKITSRDYEVASDHIENGRYLTRFAKKRADINKDGKITTDDVKAIKKYCDKLAKITDLDISGPTTLKKGELIQLTATPVPNNIDNAKISWSSSNILKALVFSNGTVLGVGYGEVTINAKFGDIKKSYKITVKDDSLGKINIKSEPNKLEYNIGDTINTYGLSLETVSKDGKTKRTVYTGFDIEPTTATKGGEQEITVKYKGKSTYFKITAGSLGNNNSTLINTATSMPDTMQETGESNANERDWKVKILRGLNHSTINQKYVSYNTQSIVLYYANRILGADINKDELAIYQNNKDKTAYWAKGNYKYSDDYTSFDDQLKTIYAELIKGYPVLMKVTNKDRKTIYVLVYGVTKTNNRMTNLSASDFRTIDPVDGTGKKLSEYYQYIYNDAPVYALVKFNENAISSISIEGNKEVAPKATTTLNAIVKNTGGVQTKIPRLMNVNWSINNTSYATVDSTGKVAGVKKGEAIVTAKSTLNSDISNTCKINITDPKTPLATVAYNLKEKCYNAQLRYVTGTISDLTVQTPVTRGSIDCSMYASWVIYEYGKINNIATYRDNFKSTKDCNGMISWFNNNTSAVKKIGSLSSNANKLQPGDIIIKGSHVEIFAYYTSNNTRYVYNCGSTNAIRNSSIATYGASTVSSSGYTVYRLIL